MELFKFHLIEHVFLVLLIQSSVILSWGFIFLAGISNRYPDTATWSKGAFSFFVTLSVFVGAYSMGKTDMYSYSIYAWSLISPTITISLILASELWFLIAVCLLGVLYGNFLLRFFVNFGKLTMIRERGRVSGFIGFISILAMSLSTAISLVLGFVGSVLLCVLLSVLPFFTTRLATVDSGRFKTEKTFSIRKNYWLKRDFLLYLVPWLIYNLVNAILGRYGTTSLIDRFQIPIVMIMVLSDLTSCIGALIGGFVADIYGRKKALGIGLTSYGISTAFSGLIFLEIRSSLLVFLLSALNGLSWGIFLVLFFYVVWEDFSDMSNNFSCYLGVGLYPLSMGIAQLLPPSIQFPLSSLALLSCVLIFSSNGFLIAAQELLSPELMKEFDLSIYLEQVKSFFKKHYGGPS